MTGHELQFSGIVRARSAAARSLVNTLRTMGNLYSERALADRWLTFIEKEEAILPFGWYQPPPHGISVLMGAPPDYGRLHYKSLRAEDNFPKWDRYSSEDAIVYPYFSAIDRKTLMIGDHVATYYRGNDRNIRDWMRQNYDNTLKIVAQARTGMTFAELYSIGIASVSAIGAKNNTYSSSGGLASDIGHTIPFFGSESPPELMADGTPEASVTATLLSKAREFISANNHKAIQETCAFTIEPQVTIEGYPMASFHTIVVFLAGQKLIVEKFKDVFEYFGMTEWVYGSHTYTDLS